MLLLMVARAAVPTLVSVRSALFVSSNAVATTGNGLLPHFASTQLLHVFLLITPRNHDNKTSEGVFHKMRQLFNTNPTKQLVSSRQECEDVEPDINRMGQKFALLQLANSEECFTVYTGRKV